jgi:DNA-binding transcriptional ArsR family regulator
MTVIPDAMLEEVARRFALLGDPTRLRVVRALHDRGESSVQEVAATVGISPPNASQHLMRLREGAIVSRRRTGKSVRYQISDPTIEALCRTVCDSVQRLRALSA